MNPLAKWNKALVGLIGVLVNVAYAYNSAHPNAYLAAALVALTALGIYQVKNAVK